MPTIALEGDPLGKEGICCSSLILTAFDTVVHGTHLSQLCELWHTLILVQLLSAEMVLKNNIGDCGSIPGSYAVARHRALLCPPVSLISNTEQLGEFLRAFRAGSYRCAMTLSSISPQHLNWGD